MRNTIHLFLALIVCTFLACADKHKTSEMNKDKHRMEEKLYPFDDYFEKKNFPETTFDYKTYFDVLKEVSKESGEQKSVGEWMTQGPGNIGARINTIAVNPKSPDEIYLGFSTGGLFKTTDGGESWESIFEENLFLSVSAIQIDPNDDNIVYIGTGDHNITGYPFIGDGVYKSMDRGTTWEAMGLEEESIISRIGMSASNSQVVYAAAMGIPFERNSKRGLYKSIDAGTSWQQVLYVNDSTGIIDLIVDPVDENIVYAASWTRIRNNLESTITSDDAHIYKTIDGGENWTMLEGGLPMENVTRIGLSLSGQDRNTLFASYSGPNGRDSCNTGGNDLTGIYKTTDGGSTWEDILGPDDTDGLPCRVQGGFAWYFGQVRVNPSDDNDIFLLGVDIYRTTDGGATWEIAAPPWFVYDVHADKHDLVFIEDEAILATDGGAYHTSEAEQIWRDIENIPTTQFYRVAYNPHRPDLYYGGAQDNGSTGGNAAMINEWERIFGGDGFQMAFHPENPEIFYVETQRGNISVTVDGGYNFSSVSFAMEGSKAWDMPYFISQHNSDIILSGSDRVYEIYVDPYGYDVITTQLSEPLTDPDIEGLTYSISTVEQSPINSDILYAGTQDGWVWSTTDYGQNWEKVIDGLPRRYVSNIKASTVEENRVYCSITGYKYNDFIPHVYMSEDNGANWVSISGDLPNLSVNDLYVLQEGGDEVIFAGTDGGIYFSADMGLSWKRLGDNMPAVPTYDMAYNIANNEIVAGTFGRGIMSFDLEQVILGMTSSSQDISLTDDFSIYPTITDGRVNIAYSGQSLLNKFSYEVFTSDGKQLVSSVKIVSALTDIDVSDFSGLLFIKVSDNKDAFVAKVIVH